MAETKTCPSCAAELPAAANRCKECFHDFTEEPPKRSGGLLFFLGVLAAMAIVGSGGLFFVVNQPLDRQILVDQESESVVFTSLYRTGPVTERLAFSDIASLEYRIHPHGRFEVIAITHDGDRRTIQESDSQLRTYAEQYARMMERPLETVDRTPDFHRPGQEEE